MIFNFLKIFRLYYQAVLRKHNIVELKLKGDINESF